MSCTGEEIYSAPDECEFVALNSACAGESVLNFFNIFYCYFDSSIGTAIPLGIVTLFALFYVLGSTADAFLSPALAKISKILKISENLAGVTFLAFGNGAPDVLSSIAASANENDGIFVSIGALVGACIFVNSFTFSLVTLVSKQPIFMPKKAYVRDVLFLIGTLILLFLFALIGTIYIAMAVVFVLIYFVYVAFVLWEERRQNARIRAERTSSILSSTGDAYGSPNEELIRRLSFDPDFDEEFDKASHHHVARNTLVTIHEEEGLRLSSLIIDDYIDNLTEEDAYYSERPFARSSSLVSRTFKKMKTNIWWGGFHFKNWIKKGVANQEWSEMSLISQIIYITVDAPFTLLRKITIPPYDEESWHRSYASVFPIGATLFIFFLFDLFTYEVIEGGGYLGFFVFPVSFIFSMAIWCNTHRRRAPRIIWIFTFLSFGMSILWIWFLANLIVDILALIGIVANIPASYLGITLLAMGNSTGDTLTNLAMTKMGYAEMAVTGCFAGPLFNLLIGLGFSFLRTIIANGPITFSLDKTSLLAIMTLVLNIVNSTFILLVVYKNKFEIKRKLAKFGIIIYLVFFLTLTIIAFAYVR